MWEFAGVRVDDEEDLFFEVLYGLGFEFVIEIVLIELESIVVL